MLILLDLKPWLYRLHEDKTRSLRKFEKNIAIKINVEIEIN